MKILNRIILLTIICILFGYLNIQPCCVNVTSQDQATAGDNPRFVAYSPTNSCVAVSNFSSSDVTIFTINPDCTLTNIGSFPTGDPEENTGPTVLKFSPDGSCLVVSNSISNDVAIFSVQADCTLVLNERESTEINPTGLAFSNDGSCLFVANKDSNSISQFSVTDCTLTLIGNLATDDAPSGVAVSPNGQCLAVVHQQSPGLVSIYEIDQDNCTLNLISNANSTLGDQPEFLSFSPSGNCLVAPNVASNNIAVFPFNQENCQIGTAQLITHSDSSQPFFPVFSPDGNCLWISDIASEVILTFTTNEDPCEFTEDGSSFVGLNLRGIDVSPNGNCVTAVQEQTELNINVQTFPIFRVSLQANSTNLCSGSDLILTANVIGAGLNTPAFSWTGPNGPIPCPPGPDCSTITIENVMPDDSGTYSVTVSVGDPVEGGCSETVTIEINVFGPSVTIFPSELTICSGDTIELAADVEGTGPFQFSWTGPNGFSSDQQTIIIPNASTQNSGTYNVTVTDSIGCIANASAEVTVNPSPIVTIEPPFLFICENQTIELISQTFDGVPPYSFSWQGPNGFTSDEEDIIIPNATSINAGTYTLTVTDSNGCQSTAQATVHIATQFQIVNETFSTCMNKPLTVLPFNLQGQNRISFVPRINSPEAQMAASELLSPMLSNSIVELVVPPAFGALNLSPNGSFTYMPRCNFVGEDSFIIRIFIENGDECNFEIQSTITIKVNQCCPLPCSPCHPVCL